MDQAAANTNATSNVDIPMETITEIVETSVTYESTGNIMFGKQKRKQLMMVTRKMDQAGASINAAENVDVHVGTSTKSTETSVTDENIGNISDKQKRKKVMVTRNMDRASATIIETINADVTRGTRTETTEPSDENESTSNISDKQKRKKVMVTKNMDQVASTINENVNADVTEGTRTTEPSVKNESIGNILPAKEKREKTVMMTRKMDQSAKNTDVTKNVDVSAGTNIEVNKTSTANKRNGNIASVNHKRNKSVMMTRAMLQSMVMDSFKATEKRNGTTFEDVRKYIAEKYPIDMKEYKFQVDSFLQKSVANGVLEKMKGSNAEGRFKIKKLENLQRDSKSLLRKDMHARKVIGLTKKK